MKNQKLISRNTIRRFENAGKLIPERGINGEYYVTYPAIGNPVSPLDILDRIT